MDEDNTRIKLTKKALDIGRAFDPSAKTDKEAALALKEAFRLDHLTEPENIRYFIYVNSYGKQPQGRDFYEELGNFEHSDNEGFVRSIIPNISAWFQTKYAGNKDAWLGVEVIGVPASSVFGYADESLGYLHKEDIKNGE